MIRRGCKRLGLSGLFSSTGPSQSHTYPLSSRGLQTTNGKDRKKNNNPPFIPQRAAWGSDEHILSPEQSDGQGQSKDITVVSETVVQSEPWTHEPGESTTPPELGPGLSQPLR